MFRGALNIYSFPGCNTRWEHGHLKIHWIRGSWAPPPVYSSAFYKFLNANHNSRLLFVAPQHTIILCILFHPVFVQGDPTKDKTLLVTVSIWCNEFGLPSIIKSFSTKLPTMNETSETTARNSKWLFFIFMIPCNCSKHVSFVDQLISKLH